MALEQIEKLKKGDIVLILGDSDISQNIKKYVEEKKECNTVVVDLKTQNFALNHYNLAIAVSSSAKISEDLLDHLLTTITLSSPFIIILTTPPPSDELAKLKSELKFSGFIGVEIKECELMIGTHTYPKTTTISSLRPSYYLNVDVGNTREVVATGGVVNGNPTEKKENLTSAQIWKLSAVDMMDDDVMDSDLVLQPTDLLKPSSDSLTAPKCGPDAANKKKKACKNCNCGLAEELEGGKEASKVVKDLPKSSCGSCYLGDAFRCAGCPYTGMPAFKPGQKVQLPSTS